MNYVEDTRDHHNYAVVSFDRAKGLDNFICTRCGARTSQPMGSEQWPYDLGECTRRLPTGESK